MIGTPTLRAHAVRQSVRVAQGILETQAKAGPRLRRPRKFLFISNVMSCTGAPLVLLRIIEEFAERYGSGRVQLVTPAMSGEIEQRISALGVKVDKAVRAFTPTFVRAQLGLQADDFVLMNTIAVHDNYRDVVLRSLECGRLAQAHWFIHEDKAQIPLVNRSLLSRPSIDRVRGCVESGKLVVHTPSRQTKLDYDKVLSTSRVRTLPLRVEVDRSPRGPRAPEDFQRIEFLLCGAPADGRKGQVLALAALQRFYFEHFARRPEQYRDFRLHLVAVGEDYMSQQVRWIAKSFEGDRVLTHPRLPREAVLDVTRRCNAVICCSLNETFALYVAEGMLMGHIVLRNGSAGVDEQLREGVNGFGIENEDIGQFAGVLERLLNKANFTDEELRDMGEHSRSMMRAHESSSYLDQLAPQRPLRAS